MAEPCTDGFGDCTDCDQTEPACCILDAAAVVVIWDSCGGPLPQICGWVPAATPGQFDWKCWEQHNPGKLWTKFTYVIENTQCDPVTDPGVMERWAMAGWGLGTSRTFVRDPAPNLRTCCGPAICTGGTTFPIQPIFDTGGSADYHPDGTPVNPFACPGIPAIGGSTRPPGFQSIFFLGDNSVKVLHPCRLIYQDVGSIEYCTITVVGTEYTPAIHKAIVDQELNNATYPARGMVRTITHPSPCVVNSGDVQAVNWPDQICDYPTPLHLGSDTSRGAKAIIRISEPGLCAPLNGLSGPTVNAQIFKYEGQGGVIHIQDCFNCGERPLNIVPPP